MKRIAILIAAALFVLGGVLPVFAQQGSKSVPMQMYHVALVKKGPAWKSQHSQEGEDARMQVIKGVRQAAKEGLVVSAGLVNDETDVEFILILDVETKHEAIALLEQAPNYKNGLFTAELYSWFAPVGLTVGPKK